MTKENKILAQKTLTYAIGIGAGYFLVLKPLLVKLGILKSSEQLAQEQAQGSNIQSYLDYNPAGLTKSIGEWQLIANTIYNELKDLAVLDNVNDAIYQLCRVQNDDDVKALISAFGKRQLSAFGFSYGATYMLPDFVKTSLSNGEITTINSNYNRKNIKFRF
jgi:hypothetical protein